jgi:DNA-directed RNA polymerase specialized sigma24 family protein
MDLHSPEIVVAAWRAAKHTLRSFHQIPEAVREEIVQEAALRTWIAREVRVPTAFAACVARRLAVDWLRGQRRTGGVALEEVDPAEVQPWQRRTEARLELERVGAALATAPALHRETLVALVVEERTVEDVLESRGVSRESWGQERDALYKRRTRAVIWLRSALAA